jgi:hypothetical protein
VARLILAGNSLTMPVRGTDDKQPVSDELGTPADSCTAAHGFESCAPASLP